MDTDDEMDGGNIDRELKFHLHPKKYSKFIKNHGFQLSATDLANETPNGIEVHIKANSKFHKRYRHALKHKKNMRILKPDYENNFTFIKKVLPEKILPDKIVLDGSGLKKSKITENIKKASLQPDHLLIPNGTLLRGVPVQGRGEYKVPLATDVHSFAIRKRTKKD